MERAAYGKEGGSYCVGGPLEPVGAVLKPSARGQLDRRLGTIHDQTPITGGVMRVRAQRSPKHADVVDELSARGDSRKAIERREVGRLNVLLTRAERDAVDWYAEATSVFPAGTENGDLIRADIPTTNQYNPATPAAGPVAPPVV